MLEEKGRLIALYDPNMGHLRKFLDGGWGLPHLKIQMWNATKCTYVILLFEIQSNLYITALFMAVTLCITVTERLPKYHPLYFLSECNADISPQLSSDHLSKCGDGTEAELSVTQLTRITICPRHLLGRFYRAPKSCQVSSLAENTS